MDWWYDGKAGPKIKTNVPFCMKRDFTIAQSVVNRLLLVLKSINYTQFAIEITSLLLSAGIRIRKGFYPFISVTTHYSITDMLTMSGLWKAWIHVCVLHMSSFIFELIKRLPVKAVDNTREKTGSRIVFAAEMLVSQIATILWLLGCPNNGKHWIVAVWSILWKFPMMNYSLLFSSFLFTLFCIKLWLRRLQTLSPSATPMQSVTHKKSAETTFTAIQWHNA